MPRSITSQRSRHPVLAWSEDTLQTNVLALATTLGWLSYHTHDSRRSQAGFPDLVMVHPVKHLLMYRELKTESGRTTPAQDAWLDALRSAGSDTEVWRPADWASQKIQRELMGVHVA